jgi:hypothetical protein
MSRRAALNAPCLADIRRPRGPAQSAGRHEAEDLARGLEGAAGRPTSHEPLRRRPSER